MGKFLCYFLIVLLIFSIIPASTVVYGFTGDTADSEIAILKMS